VLTSIKVTLVQMHAVAIKEKSKTSDHKRDQTILTVRKSFF